MRICEMLSRKVKGGAVDITALSLKKSLKLTEAELVDVIFMNREEVVEWILGCPGVSLHQKMIFWFQCSRLGILRPNKCCSMDF